MLKHSQILRLLWTAHSVTNEAALRANADISFATKSGHFNLLRTPVTPNQQRLRLENGSKFRDPHRRDAEIAELDAEKNRISGERSVVRETAGRCLRAPRLEIDEAKERIRHDSIVG